VDEYTVEEMLQMSGGNERRRRYLVGKRRAPFVSSTPKGVITISRGSLARTLGRVVL
jgi:hypothetical protein